MVNWLKKQNINFKNVDFSQAQGLQDYWELISSVLHDEVQKIDDKSSLPVIGIDELPFMLENLIKENITSDAITLALASLRKLRSAGLRMIVSGSISLDNILEFYKIPSTVLGGLNLISIKPFVQPEARSYLQEVYSSLSTDATDVILDKIPDYIPQFLKKAAIELSTFVEYSNTTATVKDLKFEMKNNIIPEINRAYLSQFDERLAKNYSAKEKKAARKILDVIAKGKKTGTRINTKGESDIYVSTLAKLKSDLFLIEAPDNAHNFSLNIMRPWWQAQRGIKS